MSSEPPFDEIVEALKAGKAIESGPDGVRIRGASPSPDPGDSTPLAMAFDESSGEPWLYVEHPADPSFEDDLAVGFNTVFVFGSDGETRIDRAAEFLLSVPGVDSVERQDESILIRGTRDAERIRDQVVAWWTAEFGARF